MTSKGRFEMKSRTLTIVAGVFCLLALHTGVTAAASGTPGAGPSGTLQGKVRIHLLEGWWTGPQGRAIVRGRFVLTGAISDRGTFVDRFQGISAPGVPFVRSLRGAKGTIWMVGDGITGRSKGHWRITKGTRAYAGLRGRGRVGIHGRGRVGAGEQYGSRFGIDLTMVGTVSR
jgi:hypothetical protein